MAFFYANENFPLAVVQELRRLGHDVLTTMEAGQAGEAIPDERVLMFARETRRAVITLNRRDFIRLHNTSSDHSGIVVCTADPDPFAQAARIHAAVTAQGSLAGVLLRVNRPDR